MKTNKQKSGPARERAWQNHEREEEATKHRTEKKTNTMADSNYFYTEESNTVHGFLCKPNIACMHVTYTFVTVHAICEGLVMRLIRVIR